MTGANWQTYGSEIAVPQMAKRKAGREVRLTRRECEGAVVPLRNSRKVVIHANFRREVWGAANAGNTQLSMCMSARSGRSWKASLPLPA